MGTLRVYSICYGSLDGENQNEIDSNPADTPYLHFIFSPKKVSSLLCHSELTELGTYYLCVNHHLFIVGNRASSRRKPDSSLWMCLFVHH